jgi:membrane protease YdiL (CAAX protease family)
MSAASRWGWLATILWSIAVIAFFCAAQIAFLIFFVSSTMGRAGPEQVQREFTRLQSNGDVIAVAAWICTPACLLALFAIVALKRGASLVDSLALHAPSRSDLARWLIAVIVFALASDALTWVLGRPIVPEFGETMYRTADNKATLWITLLFVAPLFEELFFRGFMISGLRGSRLGASGAVIVSALAWAAVHVQYDLYTIGTLAVLGLLLGAARIKTESTLTTLAMHATANAIATIEVAIHTGKSLP